MIEMLIVAMGTSVPFLLAYAITWYTFRKVNDDVWTEEEIKDFSEWYWTSQIEPQLN